MNRAQTKKQSGFTIIEVMIVLAIAGVIMLLVFLAIPALQRNNRNTQRRNDVAAIGGAISEYTTNNNGALPATAANITSNAKLGFYTNADVTLTAAAPNVTATTAPTINQVQVVTGYKCATSSTAVAGTSRNVIGVYYVETSGNPQAQCQDL